MNEPLYLPPQQGIPVIEIIAEEGSAPRTRNVEMATAANHIIAGDQLAGEAEILLAFAECADCEDDDPVGFKWNDPTEDARFIFDTDELEALEAEGALVVAVRVIGEP